jgi:hypothetical protein
VEARKEELVKRLTASLIGAMLALSPGLEIPPARADVVRLKIGRDLFGQGWMFLDNDGTCKVVTAAHVVRGPDGSIRMPLVLDAHGREWTAGPVLLASSNPDIAVLAIPSANSPSACGDGRLSAIGAERRVVEMTQAVILTTGRSEVVEVPVSRRASAMDAARGEVFAVRPQLESDKVMKGWSGSVVRDATGPIGIVYEVDPTSNEAYAVRVDVIRRLMAAQPPGPATAAGVAMPPAIAVLEGTTDDTRRGPSQLQGSGWFVTPRQRTVVFVVGFPQPVQVRSIGLASVTNTDNRLEAIGIATQAEGTEGWIDSAFCRMHEAEAAIACPLLQHTVSRIRILVKTATDAPIGLNRLTIQ